MTDMTNHARRRAPRVRSLLGRLDGWTLWAFNAPGELASRRVRG